MPYKDSGERREYGKRWVAERRREFFQGKSCKLCGCNDISQLVLHHRDPSQKESHKIWSWSEERRSQELEKCEVFCDSCHRELHASLCRRHGTRKRYDSGCRCDACRAVHSEHLKKLYVKRKERERIGVLTEVA